MKFFLFIIFSAVGLTLFGLFSYSKKCSEDAKRYREQRKIELSNRSDTQDFWFPEKRDMIITYPKKKPVLVINKPTPQTETPSEMTYTKRVITAVDQRKDYVYAKKWVDGREVEFDNSIQKEIANRYFGL